MTSRPIHPGNSLINLGRLRNRRATNRPNTILKTFEELLGYDTRPRVYSQLHLGYFFVDFFHEVYHEIDQLVFVHLFGMEVCDQEADVVPEIISG